MKHDILLKISQLASRDPFYMGWHLARYLEMKGVSAVELGKELGCLPETIDSISLCRAPRSEPPHFQSDIERVADRFQVSADKLMNVVRFSQVANYEATLLASRDREADEDEDGDPDG